MKLKENTSLIIGLAIPILMILFVAGSIYLPGLFVNPQYDFLYSVGDAYYSGQQYNVIDGKLQSPLPLPSGLPTHLPRQEPKFYMHDVKSNQSREVTLQQAQAFFLDTKPQSPDGFEAVYGSRGDGIFPFFFWTGTDYNSRYLKGRNVSKKLNLQFPGSYYNFRFLGWIR